jgi:hypothetical protein
LECQQQVQWHHAQGWYDLCRDFSQRSEVFSPRFYRLSLNCRYRTTRFSWPLGELAWLEFR